ncbi:terminase [Arsenophonus sp. aPb]|uniref:terminase n=1 Tax=Arsenophonus sp. aPb TaxID=3041619 RepID=UPI00246833DB|nr:terminase [Arsenophonus sp. aPb]WGL98663.1 terminase [Arsenophonus sp. aPb]
MSSKEKTKKKRGAPTLYKEEYAEQSRKICLLGATDKQIADFFEVSERTLNYWKKVHPEFLQSLKKGKILADAEVAESLYKKAIGFQYTEKKIRIDSEGKKIVAIYERQSLPDTIAMFFWLKNRHSKYWREKKDIPTEKDNFVYIHNSLPNTK